MKKYFSIQNHTLIRCFLIFQLHSWLKLIWCNTGITALQVFDCYSCIPCDIPNTVVRRRDCNFLDPGIKIDNRIHPEVCHPHEQISNPGTNVVYGIGSGGTNSQAPFPRRWHNTVTTFLFQPAANSVPDHPDYRSAWVDGSMRGCVRLSLPR